MPSWLTGEAHLHVSQPNLDFECIRLEFLDFVSPEDHRRSEAALLSASFGFMVVTTTTVSL